MIKLTNFKSHNKKLGKNVQNTISKRIKEYLNKRYKNTEFNIEVV